jgi:hypothetical protein
VIQDLTHDDVSFHMDARPGDVYAVVSDVTRTPELSPEILECTWLDGATGPAVGARFKARNKVPNRPAWHNKPVVTVVDPGREFAFARTEAFAGTVEWRYRFEPDGDGTLVTESYTVTKNLSPVGWFIIGVLFARKDRRADLRAGMKETLQRLRATVESARPPRVLTRGASFGGRHDLSAPRDLPFARLGNRRAPAGRGEEQRIDDAVADDFVAALERDVGEARLPEAGRQCGPVEPVVAAEAVTVERPVLLLEVDDAQVTTVGEQVGERGEHRFERRDVVQGLDGHDEIEALVGNRLGGEVDVPHPGVGDRARRDLLLHHLAHPGRGVGHRHRSDEVAQRLGDKTRPRAVLEHPDRCVERDRGADRVRNHFGPLPLRRVVIPARSALVEEVLVHRVRVTNQLTQTH